jgi:hypothetical protein
MFDLVRVWIHQLFDAEAWWRRWRAPTWNVVTSERNTAYSGEYAVWDSGRRRAVTVRGYVVEWPGLAADVYLYDPPAIIRQHPHGRCLQLLRPDEKWFHLHWERPARTFQESKELVERMLWETLNVAR